MKVAIVILNWNGKKLLEQFLPKVVEYSKDIAEVVIADNDSKDDSLEFLRTNYPDIRLIINQENGGFAKGYNDALKHVDAEYYILLNSDVEVTPCWIQPIISMMENDKTIAACQPKMLSFKNKEKFEYAGAAGGFIDHWGYPFCQGRIFGNLEKDHGQYNETLEVFWSTGACMFVRADVFHKLNGFDEEFFAHMEEIDLCWRIRNAGYKVMYCPQSVVYHVGGGTLPKNNPRKTYLNFRNNLLMIYKNAPAKDLWKICLLRFILDGVAGAKFLFEGNWKDCIAVVKAHFYFYQNYSKINKNRKATIKSSLDNSGNFIYPGSIVFEYYLKGKRTFTSLHWEVKSEK
jgi:GT2 family glycosyltransferase